MNFWLSLILAGIGTGCIYSLAGMGIVLTYKATGIFNFAHGAIAMFVAYILWQMNAQWGISLLIAAPVTLLIVGPGIGLILERFIFRPLQRRGAGTSEKLVATLGVFLLLVGLALKIWTGTERHGPELVSNKPIHLTPNLIIGADRLAVVIMVAVISIVLYLLFHFTHLGTKIRAVVDRRELSELAAINANRVAAFSWAMGAGLAGLTGVLLAPDGLDPIRLTLLVVETFSIAVVARLVSIPVAVAAGVLLLGVLQSLLTQFNPTVSPLFHTHWPHWFTETIAALKPNLSVLILFAALLIYRNLDEVGEGGSGISRFISRSIGGTGKRRAETRIVIAVVAVALVLLPFMVNDINIAYGQQMLALMVIFVSIVVITGFSGHITLGQAAFAGMGSFVSVRVSNSLGVPVIPSMLIGAVVAVFVGLIAGYPALKRKGLFLGLTTLAIGILSYSLVFVSNIFAKGSAGLTVHRPSIFGLSLEGDKAFYWFELVCVALALLLANNLRKGRLGRILAAMRDSETAARSIGIDLRAYKLFIFGASAFIAGIGGALLSQQAHAFSPTTQFEPISSSLLWFVALIVAGVGSLGGAVVGAAGLVLLAFFGLSDVAPAFIALGALLIGYLPGGSIMGMLQRLTDWLRTPKVLLDRFATAQQEVARNGPAGSANGARAATNGHRPEFVVSEFGERVLEGAQPE
ncbi:MAG: ABC transporter permease [Acidimicrobiia bacterium]|nr:ABC transporter permease [Acidimicrobiia bacterium]MBV8296506.1 ABC transporter permease [Acidimicrobiia bacterium]